MTFVPDMKRRPWTGPDLAVLRERYPTTRTPELARLLERPVASVYTKALQLGLRKTAAYMSESHGPHLAAAGVATRRKAGDTPWNRELHYMPTGNGETRFKPGQAPHNTLPLGSYRISGDGYLQLKVSENSGSPSKRWRSVHELVWIEAHGPVPAGHVVVFRPGRRTQTLAEITLDAVELVNRAEMMRRNTVHRHGPEIARLSQIKGAIVRQINRREREQA
ncbi:MAG: HNH endonuclease [Tessaracoccus sp.]|uniref:hypothetical protein n=1 Tax=Tessaracoccus sp. TaxID=1971211 RepID=UPI001EB5F7E6|nr:hypothetical protein [Tessaracoccus sp.]MBK7822969.1 HNH endonuclease [Tessaracoccus sp.]